MIHGIITSVIVIDFLSIYLIIPIVTTIWTTRWIGSKATVCDILTIYAEDDPMRFLTVSYSANGIEYRAKANTLYPIDQKSVKVGDIVDILYNPNIAKKPWLIDEKSIYYYLFTTWRRWRVPQI